MDSQTIKTRVTIQELFAYFGSLPDHRGRAQCLCPARHRHGDVHPSVTFINDTATCHSQGCFQGADIFVVVGVMEGLDTFPEQMQWICERLNVNETTEQTNSVATYDYVDEEGTLLYQVVRYEPKSFHQRRPDGHGGWTWNVQGTRRVLYHLPDVLRAETVLILEGEKDVDTAYRLGLPPGWAATCSPMGAGKWRPEYSEVLQGKVAVLCPDQDEAGFSHADQVATALRPYAKDMYRLDLPIGKDLTEWANQ